MENLYRAVDAAELVRVLGAQCSSDPRRGGYVIGPDVTGRLGHVASCFSMGEAINCAAQMNRKEED